MSKCCFPALSGTCERLTIITAYKAIIFVVWGRVILVLGLFTETCKSAICSLQGHTFSIFEKANPEKLCYRTWIHLSLPSPWVWPEWEDEERKDAYKNKDLNTKLTVLQKDFPGYTESPRLLRSCTNHSVTNQKGQLLFIRRREKDRVTINPPTPDDAAKTTQKNWSPKPHNTKSMPHTRP